MRVSIEINYSTAPLTIRERKERSNLGTP